MELYWTKRKGDTEYFNNFTHFLDYKNLKFIEVEPVYNNPLWMPANNIFPYICTRGNCSFFKDKDGNKCPTGCECIFQRDGETLVIDCRNPLAVTEFKALPKSYIGDAALYLTGRNLTKLPSREVSGYSSLQKLYFDRNQLDDLTISELPENLTFLSITHNNLKLLSTEVYEFLGQRKDLKIRLSENPWSCGCTAVDYMKFLSSFEGILDDFKDIKCEDGPKVISKLDECRVFANYLVGGLAILLIVVCLVVFWFRKSILMWLYERGILVQCIRRTNHELDHKFDAFIAFPHENLNLVNEYVDQLENGPYEYKLCFYHRDWLIGESIPACILKSIDDSKRTIVLMTNEFLSSSWGSFEFRTAIRATSVDPSKRLIVIVYPEAEDFSKLDSELRIYMKYNTYLKRADSQFWRKLFYAMPHKKVSKPKKAKKKTDV